MEREEGTYVCVLRRKERRGKAAQAVCEREARRWRRESEVSPWAGRRWAVARCEAGRWVCR